MKVQLYETVGKHYWLLLMIVLYWREGHSWKIDVGDDPQSVLRFFETYRTVEDVYRSVGMKMFSVTASRMSQPPTDSDRVLSVEKIPVKVNANASFTENESKASPGINYDGVIMSSGIRFGEHFQGTTVVTENDQDLVSGSEPNSPLRVSPGRVRENIALIKQGKQRGVV